MIRGSIGRLKNRLRVLGLTQWLDEYLGCGTSWLCAVGGFDGQGFESLIDESEGSASHKSDKDFL